MALIHCDFYSESLGLSTSMYVILPQPSYAKIKSGQPLTKHPTLYLLHGLSDDHTMWLRRTSIERYAEPLGLAVVMPAVHRSFYADMRRGNRYWTYISEELPAVARSLFPLSDAREDNFAAGLSMGGYGAFKLALTHPDRYAAAASLSGALDAAALYDLEHSPASPEELSLMFGSKEQVKGSPDDLFHLAARTASSEGPQPDLLQCCGTEDFLYADNIRFRDYARSLGLRLTYEEERGTHEWGYWDAMIQRVLKWLPMKPQA